jgi:hypothetical protein
MAKDFISPSQSATKVVETYQENLKRLKELLLDSSVIRTDINVGKIQKTLSQVMSAGATFLHARFDPNIC